MADDDTPTPATQLDQTILPSPGKEDLVLDRERWKGRRQMSWAALGGIFTVTVMLFYPVVQCRTT